MPEPSAGLPCNIFKALSPGGNPEFGMVMKVIRALGLELRGAAAKL